MLGLERMFTPAVTLPLVLDDELPELEEPDDEPDELLAVEEPLELLELEDPPEEPEEEPEDRTSRKSSHTHPVLPLTRT